MGKINTIKLHVDNNVFELTGYFDEPIQYVIDRFNSFRSPDDQIIKVYNKLGQSVPLNIKIRGNYELFNKPPPSR